MVDAGPDAAPAQARLEFSPASFDIPLVGEGERVVRDITLTNASDVSVEITNFGLNVATGTAVLVYGSRRIIGITADGTDTFPYPVAIEAGDTLLLSVEYTLGAGEPSGEVTIEGNFDGGLISVPIRAFSSVGTISTEPSEVNFGRVQEDTMSTQSVTVTNTGETVLNIRDIQKDSNIYFSLAVGGTDPISMPSVYEDPDGDGEPGLAPGASFAIDVTFAPTREGTQRSLLIIDSDDPLNPEIRIPMVGNESEGCILASAESLTWSGALGMATPSPELTVSNCGDGPLYIDRIGLTPGTAAVLTLNEDMLPEFPLELAAGSDPLLLQAVFTPQFARRYRGNIQIISNDPMKANIIIPLTATAACSADTDCEQGYRCQDTECVEIMME